MREVGRPLLSKRMEMLEGKESEVMKEQLMMEVRFHTYCSSTDRHGEPQKNGWIFNKNARCVNKAKLSVLVGCRVSGNTADVYAQQCDGRL